MVGIITKENKRVTIPLLPNLFPKKNKKKGGYKITQIVNSLTKIK